MTKIKLCGLMRECDIEKANELQPEYIGFVFAKNSKRYVSPEIARQRKKELYPQIKAVGVFVNEDIDHVVRLLKEGIIDVAQLHGNEDEAYIARLRERMDCEGQTSGHRWQIIKAFRIEEEADIAAANQSSADYVLLDSGKGGTGQCFDWQLITGMKRDYFLAGGLNPLIVEDAIKLLHPYAVDVSSGIETAGCKDLDKMSAFVAAVRK